MLSKGTYTLQVLILNIPESSTLSRWLAHLDSLIWVSNIHLPIQNYLRHRYSTYMRTVELRTGGYLLTGATCHLMAVVNQRNHAWASWKPRVSPTSELIAMSRARVADDQFLRSQDYKFSLILKLVNEWNLPAVNLLRTIGKCHVIQDKFPNELLWQ